MQMQGEPVTISNIEENVKKGFNVEGEEESVFVKILLFPFRLIAIVFKALGELLGPLLKFSVEALRVLVGVFFVFLGFVLMISFSITLAVLLGIGGAMEGLVHFGELPVQYLIGSFSTFSLICAYLVSAVPSLGLALLGLSIILRRSVTKAVVGWSLFGLWLLGMIGLAFSIPMIVREFAAENDYNEEQVFEVKEGTPTLTINDIYDDLDFDYRYDAIDLRLRGHEDSTYRLVLNVESRGSSRSEAKANAQDVNYKVQMIGDEILFDSDIAFNEETPFRFQNVNATFYIPYGKKFHMDDDLGEIIINTLHLNGYRRYHMEGNDWIFDEDGINCLTCKESRGSSYLNRRENRRSQNQSQTYEFSNFDEVRLISLFDFEIRKGDDYSVQLEGDDDDLRKVSVEQRGDELEIKYRTNWKWWKDKK